VFIPAWVAFRFAGSWRSTLTWSLTLAIAAYTASFALAIVFNQPYGPVLVAALVVVGCGRAFVRDGA
jgi:zinc transport system permease protein